MIRGLKFKVSFHICLMMTFQTWFIETIKHIKSFNLQIIQSKIEVIIYTWMGNCVEDKTLLYIARATALGSHPRVPLPANRSLLKKVTNNSWNGILNQSFFAQSLKLKVGLLPNGPTLQLIISPKMKREGKAERRESL